MTRSLTSKRVLIVTFPDAKLDVMKTHEQIDRRSLALAQAVADVIDRDPTGVDLDRARTTCRRWYQETPSPAVEEWGRILGLEWEAIRQRLLDPGEEGRRLRQSSPFCGILSPRERWEIYRFTPDPKEPLPDPDKSGGKPINGFYRAGSDHRKDGGAVGW